MISANGGLPAHRYTPQVTQRWPRGSEPASRDKEEAAPLDKSALPDELWHDLERAYEHRETPEQILVNLRKKYSEDAYPAIKGFSSQHIRNFLKSIERKMGPNDLARLINHLKMLKQADPA